MHAKRGGLRKSHAWGEVGHVQFLHMLCIIIMVSFDNLEIKLGDLLIVKEEVVVVYLRKYPHPTTKGIS